MSSQQRSLALERTTRVLGFAIGVCGAFAILGVFFKIIEGPYYQTFMYLGFIGEAVAFLVMGFLELGQAFTVSAPSDADASESSAALSSSGPAEGPLREGARSMMQEKVDEDLDRMLDALGTEVKEFGVEMTKMAEEMNHTRAALHDMRTTLDEVSSGRLAEDADQLGSGMSTLGTEMADAGETVETMRDDLDRMLARLRRFNNVAHTTNGTEEAVSDSGASH
ncbi:MAG: hypothetical protein R6T83_02960 [Salinibacter sp.]